MIQQLEISGLPEDFPPDIRFFQFTLPVTGEALIGCYAGNIYYADPTDEFYYTKLMDPYTGEAVTAGDKGLPGIIGQRAYNYQYIPDAPWEILDGKISTPPETTGSPGKVRRYNTNPDRFVFIRRTLGLPEPAPDPFEIS